MHLCNITEKVVYKDRNRISLPGTKNVGSWTMKVCEGGRWNYFMY